MSEEEAKNRFSSLEDEGDDDADEGDEGDDFADELEELQLWLMWKRKVLRKCNKRSRTLQRVAAGQLDREAIKACNVIRDEVVEEIARTQAAVAAFMSPPSASYSSTNSQGSSSPRSVKPSSLPKNIDTYVHGTTDLHTWLEIAEARMIAHGTPPAEYYRIFGQITKGPELLWVKQHLLVLVPPPVWVTAKRIFMDEYMSNDYAHKCRNTLTTLAQGDRSGAAYLREVESLAEGAAQNLNEPFFLHLLVHHKLTNKLRAALSVRFGEQLADISFEDLKTHVTFLDSVDLSALIGHSGNNKSGKGKDSGAASSSESSSSASGVSKGDGKKKECKWCKQRTDKHNYSNCPKRLACVCTYCGHTGHDISSCRTKLRESRDNVEVKTNRRTGARVPAENGNEHITCFKCGRKGHYSSTCTSAPAAAAPQNLDMNNVRNRVRVLQEQKANTDANAPSPEEESFAQALYDIYNDVKPEGPP
jgi:hypothetical protein